MAGFSLAAALQRADQYINMRLGGRLSAAPPDMDARRNDFAARWLRRLHQDTGPVAGQHAGVPPRIPPRADLLEWLRFEVVREGLLLADSVIETAYTGWARPAPQCFLAIDPYALDTIPTPVAGLYSGLMYRMYLAWDRMSRTQSPLLAGRYFIFEGAATRRLCRVSLRACGAVCRW